MINNIPAYIPVQPNQNTYSPNMINPSIISPKPNYTYELQQVALKLAQIKVELLKQKMNGNFTEPQKEILKNDVDNIQRELDFMKDAISRI